VTSLERDLRAVEEQLAWCVAVKAPREILERLLGMLARARAAEHAPEAEELIQAIRSSTAAMLPRGRALEPRLVRPERDGADFRFDSSTLQARVDERGTLLEIGARGTPNPVAQANLLGARRPGMLGSRRMRVFPGETALREGGLEVSFLVGASPATMRLSHLEGEPFLRVELALDWRERRGGSLQMETWLALAGEPGLLGADSGGRFAHAGDARCALAIFALDADGWKSRRLKHGLHLIYDLLRSAKPARYDLTWAFAPSGGADAGALEAAWERFAYPPRVRLFTSAEDGVVVDRCRPAGDGDGVILDVRECAGSARPVRLRCGARMRAVEPEAPRAEEVRIEAEELVAMIPASATLSFRVRFA
jgi:hypothetical protein